MEVSYKDKSILDEIEWEIRESKQEGDVIEKIELDLDEMHELLQIVFDHDNETMDTDAVSRMLLMNVDKLVVIVKDTKVVLAERCIDCEDNDKCIDQY